MDSNHLVCIVYLPTTLSCSSLCDLLSSASLNFRYCLLFNWGKLRGIRTSDSFRQQYSVVLKPENDGFSGRIYVPAYALNVVNVWKKPFTFAPRTHQAEHRHSTQLSTQFRFFLSTNMCLNVSPVMKEAIWVVFPISNFSPRTAFKYPLKWKTLEYFQIQYRQLYYLYQ